MERREYDIIVYGATGFVGRRVAAYLATSAPESLRWAVAGRNREKLEALAAEHGARRAGVIVADSSDGAAVAWLAARSRVVLSTAGPFAKFGDPVVAACVLHRTGYVDITGETPWVRSLIDRFDAQAASQGTRIVPCCGFDSVPSDLGAFLIARHLQASGARGCRDVAAYFSMAGGLNGGTLASLLAIGENPEQLKMFREPFLLSPGIARTTAEIARNRDPQAARFDTGVNAWVAPFAMGPINTRVVRRSADVFARWQEPYGERFRYQEYLRFGEPFAMAQAFGVAAGTALVTGALEFAGERRALEPLLPKPGTGPSEAAMRDGWYRCDLIGRGDDGRVVRGTIRDAGDPGNVATAKFVCESALALALESEALPGGAARGGVLTPATAFGDVLARRLREAGTTIDVA